MGGYSGGSGGDSSGGYAGGGRDEGGGYGGNDRTQGYGSGGSDRYGGGGGGGAQGYGPAGAGSTDSGGAGPSPSGGGGAGGADAAGPSGGAGAGATVSEGGGGGGGAGFGVGDILSVGGGDLLGTGGDQSALDAVASDPNATQDAAPTNAVQGGGASIGVLDSTYGGAPSDTSAPQPLGAGDVPAQQDQSAFDTAATTTIPGSPADILGGAPQEVVSGSGEPPADMALSSIDAESPEDVQFRHTPQQQRIDDLRSQGYEVDQKGTITGSPLNPGQSLGPGGGIVPYVDPSTGSATSIPLPRERPGDLEQVQPRDIAPDAVLGGSDVPLPSADPRKEAPENAGAGAPAVDPFSNDIFNVPPGDPTKPRDYSVTINEPGNSFPPVQPDFGTLSQPSLANQTADVVLNSGERTPTLTGGGAENEFLSSVKTERILGGAGLDSKLDFVGTDSPSATFPSGSLGGFDEAGLGGESLNFGAPSPGPAGGMSSPAAPGSTIGGTGDANSSNPDKPLASIGPLGGEAVSLDDILSRDLPFGSTGTMSSTETAVENAPLAGSDPFADRFHFDAPSATPQQDPNSSFADRFGNLPPSTTQDPATTFADRFAPFADAAQPPSSVELVPESEAPPDETANVQKQNVEDAKSAAVDAERFGDFPDYANAGARAPTQLGDITPGSFTPSGAPGNDLFPLGPGGSLGTGGQQVTGPYGFPADLGKPFAGTQFGITEAWPGTQPGEQLQPTPVGPDQVLGPPETFGPPGGAAGPVAPLPGEAAPNAVPPGQLQDARGPGGAREVGPQGIKDTRGGSNPPPILQDAVSGNPQAAQALWQLTPAQQQQIAGEQQATINEWRQIFIDRGSLNPESDPSWAQVVKMIQQQTDQQILQFWQHRTM